MAIIHLTFLVLTTLLFPSSALPTFQYGFQISNLLVFSPPSHNANVSTIANSSVSFNFFDHDAASFPAVWCVCAFPPNSTSADCGMAACSNTTYIFSIPSYESISNLSLHLEHTYEDDSLGPFPYNFNTKIGNLTLAYGETRDYVCDLGAGKCKSCDGTILEADVTMATA